MEYRYTLDIVPYSLNNYRNAHHFKLHQVKKDYGENITWQLIKQKVRRVSTPVSITLRFHWKDNRLHDLDNYGGATSKLLLDALTPPNEKKNYGVGIIPDDSTKYIKEITIQAGEEKKDLVELIITEI